MSDPDHVQNEKSSPDNGNGLNNWRIPFARLSISMVVNVEEKIIKSHAIQNHVRGFSLTLTEMRSKEMGERGFKIVEDSVVLDEILHEGGSTLHKVRRARF
jgi:hypothetical protein